MKPTQPPVFIRAYSDKFQFVEAKKFLALKGPLEMKVVHDRMYPILPFNSTLVIIRPPQGFPRARKLACFWEEEIIHPCLITRVFNDGSFKIKFLNGEKPSKVMAKDFYLGEILYPKIPIIWKFRFWRYRE